MKHLQVFEEWELFKTPKEKFFVREIEKYFKEKRIDLLCQEFIEDEDTIYEIYLGDHHRQSFQLLINLNQVEPDFKIIHVNEPNQNFFIIQNMSKPAARTKVRNLEMALDLIHQMIQENAKEELAKKEEEIIQRRKQRRHFDNEL